MTADRRTARELIRVTGLVQGVGFRPTVYLVARDLGLGGFVFNDAQGVGIEIEGDSERVAQFCDRLRENCPPLARIDSMTVTVLEPQGETEFRITASQGGKVTTAITADAATCRACALDMFTPGNRRYRYAFTNCTHCGPRFTITRALPYDRPQTSMAPFIMCPDCQSEYEDPGDRRFHAQPNACPACGPQLRLVTNRGEPVASVDPIADAVRLLREGRILAVKGLGGFHLVCDAENPQAVATLRARKRRDEKPLAVMVANVPSAERLVRLFETEKKSLTAISRPIVLAKKSARPASSLTGVAPGLSELGVMLPYTPVHLLLFHEAAGRPDGVEWLDRLTVPFTLVMTSANPGGEPLVIGNDEAIERLGPIADFILMHDRDILIRCDDSVVRIVGGRERMVRRARGYTPQAVKLAAEPRRSVLTTGPGLKVTACLTRGSEAFLSQHIGDLSNKSSCTALRLAVKHLETVLEIEPEVLAHDLHPDFYSTRLAEELAAERGIPTYAVQHHRAHIGAVMAEHGITGRVCGLALDGVGIGTDGKAWGGELLEVTPTGFTRKAHLMSLALPGWDKAAREPWRMAGAVLARLGRAGEITERFGDQFGAPMLEKILENPRLSGRTTAMGRYFDAASALLGLCPVQHDEATAAMRLEAAAEGRTAGRLPALHRIEPDGTLDLLPLMEMLCSVRRTDAQAVSQASADFHEALAAALCDWTLQLADTAVPLCLAGGCFLNRRLTERMLQIFAERGVQALLGEQTPPGDGGVALGQAWCAALADREGALSGGDRIQYENV
ncbi:MAG: carbamoyltransferase HypF [Duodenibacillus sp.]|nr:carbamoyltransferase HypF [Duodenibacillus sp.]